MVGQVAGNGRRIGSGSPFDQLGTAPLATTASANATRVKPAAAFQTDRPPVPESHLTNAYTR
jgi:hypothetical protein